MNVLSLFDGISCGRVALERAGIHVDNYYASEIDKHAIAVSKDNWKENTPQGIIHIGDVTKVSFADGESINNPVREGVVFKCVTNGDISFKAISNKLCLLATLTCATFPLAKPHASM